MTTDLLLERGWVRGGHLFVGGVMNLLWIAAIATFVFAEKVIPVPDSPMPSRLAGWGE